jgi:hypothetical protein
LQPSTGSPPTLTLTPTEQRTHSPLTSRGIGFFEVVVRAPVPKPAELESAPVTPTPVTASTSPRLRYDAKPYVPMSVATPIIIPQREAVASPRPSPTLLDDIKEYVDEIAGTDDHAATLAADLMGFIFNDDENHEFVSMPTEATPTLNADGVDWKKNDDDAKSLSFNTADWDIEDDNSDSLRPKFRF